MPKLALAREQSPVALRAGEHSVAHDPTNEPSLPVTMVSVADLATWIDGAKQEQAAEHSRTADRATSAPQRLPYGYD